MPFPIEDFNVTFPIANAADATNQVILIAPYDCKLVSVQARHRIASTSGTMDVVKVANGTAISAGTSMLTGTMSNAGTVDTNVSGSLKTGIGDTTIPKGSAIAVIFAGTLTNLLDLDVTMIVRQLKKF